MAIIWKTSVVYENLIPNDKKGSPDSYHTDNITLTARVELVLIDSSQHGDNLDTLKQQYTSELLAGNIVRKLIVKQNSLFNKL